MQANCLNPKFWSTSLTTVAVLEAKQKQCHHLMPQQQTHWWWYMPILVTPFFAIPFIAMVVLY